MCDQLFPLSLLTVMVSSAATGYGTYIADYNNYRITDVLRKLKITFRELRENIIIWYYAMRVNCKKKMLQMADLSFRR